MSIEPESTGHSESQGSLYPGHRVLFLFPFCNEQDKLQLQVPRLRSGLVDKWLGVDDGSTDESAAIVRRAGIEVIDQGRRGLGAAIRTGTLYARKNGYDIVGVMAGNNKDEPEEIPRLLAPIIAGEADYVQGSRYLGGGSSPNLPPFRYWAIKCLSVVFQVWTRQRCTDLTNGFRAYTTALFDNTHIDVAQSWLDHREYEFYLHYKVFTLGYRVKEVPVTKSYPRDRNVEYSKIRGLADWWSMLRPLLFLALRIRQ